MEPNEAPKVPIEPQKVDPPFRRSQWLLAFAHAFGGLLMTWLGIQDRDVGALAIGLGSGGIGVLAIVGLLRTSRA
jgi:hypothetical protein